MSTAMRYLSNGVSYQDAVSLVDRCANAAHRFSADDCGDVVDAMFTHLPAADAVRMLADLRATAYFFEAVTARVRAFRTASGTDV